MVLVVVGILSAAAVGLFASKSDFSASLAKDQLISSVHLAQQRALASHALDPITSAPIPVLLKVGQTASDWTFTISQGSVSFESQTVERAGASLSITGLTLPADIAFSQQGNLSSSAGDLVSVSDLTASFSGESSHIVCISSAGFAFAAACP